jgi:hypothetical protein
MHVCACTRPRARVPTCTHAQSCTHRPICNTDCFSTATMVSWRASMLRFMDMSVLLNIPCAGLDYTPLAQYTWCLIDQLPLTLCSVTGVCFSAFTTPSLSPFWVTGCCTASCTLRTVPRSHCTTFYALLKTKREKGSWLIGHHKINNSNKMWKRQLAH